MNARTQMSAWSHGVLETAVLLAVATVPAFVNYYAYSVFEQSKAALAVSFGLLAALAGAVALAERARLDDLGGALRQPLVLAGLASWVVALVATVTSISSRVSLLGSYDRADGLVFLTACAVLFLAAAWLAGSPARRDRLVSMLVVGSVPVVAATMVQVAGVEIVSGHVEAVGRAFGTLSNPIFLGAYLMMVTPVTLALALREWRRAHVVLAAVLLVLAALQAVGVVASDSRGPELGFVAGLVALGVAWAAVRGRRPVAVGLGALAAVVVAALILVNLPGTALNVRGAPVIGRLAQISDTSSGPQAVRLRIWTSTERLLAREPARLVTGYGPETLRYALLPVVEPNVGGRIQANRLVDRAHNVLLDALAMTGVLGAAALLFTVGALIFTAVSALGLAGDRRLRLRLTALIAGGGVVGLLLGLAPGALPYAPALVLLGLAVGGGLYVFLRALSGAPAVDTPSDTEPLALGLLAVAVAVAVEYAFGIQTVVTQLIFWVLAGIVAAVGWQSASGAGRTSSHGAEPGGRGQRVRAAEGQTAPARREITVSWSPGGAALGLVVGAVLDLTLFMYLGLGSDKLPPALPVVAGMAVATWVAGGLLGAVAGESGAAAALVSALSLALYGLFSAVVLAAGGTAEALFALTVAWLAALGLLGGFWLRERGGRMPLVSVPAVIAYPLLGIGAVAAALVLAVRPVQADMFFQTATSQFEAALATDDTAAFQAAEDAYSLATSANPREAFYPSRWSEMYTVVGSSSSADPATAARWFDRAQMEAAKAESIEPLMPYHAFQRGHLQVLFAQMLPEDQRQAAASNAETALQEAFDGAPTDPEVANELALAKLLQGNAAGAVALLEYVRDQLDPENATTWQLLGAAYSAAGRTDDAAAAAQRALELGGATPANLVALGDMERKNGDTGKAIEWYEKAVAAGPVSWEVLYNLGLLYKDAGNRDKSVDTLSMAMQQAPDEEARTRIQDALSVLLGVATPEP